MQTKFFDSPLAELPINSLIKQIKNPDNAVPAGGSTIALSAASAVALTELTLQVSSKEWSGQLLEDLQPLADQLSQLEDLLLKQITEDAEAYLLNQQEKFKDREQIKLLVKTPLTIAEAVNRAITINHQLTPYIKKLLLSDLKVAAHLLQGCQQGAVEIIKTNLRFFDFAVDFRKEVEARLDKLQLTTFT